VSWGAPPGHPAAWPAAPPIAAQAFDAQEGVPILCRRCGAPTEPRHDMSLVCRHCGQVDQLPPDALGRALDIKNRLASAAASVAQLDGVESALASIFEQRGAFLRVTGPWPVLAAIVIAYAAINAVTTLGALPRAVPDSVRLQLLVGAAYGPLFVLGIAVSFPVALLVGRTRYRMRVRPLLLARPPLAPGAAMRCRGCGAPLSPTREAFSRCRHCQTQNLVTDEVARQQGRLLAEEAASYRARAMGAVSSASTASLHMSRVLVVCLVLVYLGVIGFGFAAEVVVAAIG
jgi:predicted amidophosphoribosyltransferase